MKYLRIRLRFNPRTRKGATNRLSSIPYHYHRFNPRTRKGATKSIHLFHLEYKVSIHAPAKVRQVDSFNVR